MPSYKVKTGTVLLPNGKTAVAGDNVDVSEAEARAHPDIYDLGEEDERLTPPDGTKPDEVDEKTKQARAEAIRYEQASAPQPAPTGKDGKKRRPDDAEATAERLHTETQRAETEKRGVMDRLRGRGGHSDKGGDKGSGPEGGGA